MNHRLNLQQKLLLFSFLIIYTYPVQAQITPDNTLGTEASRVTENVLIKGVNANRIGGGARREGNLFHSFNQFNIGDGQKIYFNNPSGIKNILTRVTGGNPSNILGTLGVEGNANLFLINPSGIVFGENASLDINGSFIGTTASGINFGEQGIFSAVDKRSPGLLTVNPDALFLNQIQANATITNKSQTPAGINPDGNETTGLRVPDGKSLLLVGGEINLDGGSLRAYGGRVELAALKAPGTVGLNSLGVSGDTFSLSVPQDIERGDISLRNESVISTYGTNFSNGGGDIIINAGNLEISNSSALFGGIGKNSDNPNTKAGNITLNATGSILIQNSSGINNGIDGKGSSGDISLLANESISILADSRILNNIEAGGVGKVGNIDITGKSLFLSDGSQIQTLLGDADINNNLTGGVGSTGNININVLDKVNITGIKDGIASSIFTRVGTGAKGNAGSINIKANSFSISGGSELDSRTFGEGNGGDINIEAGESISLDGFGNVLLEDGSIEVIPTRISSNTSVDAIGNAGSIQVSTETLKITNTASISSDVFYADKGNSGDIKVNVDSAFLTDGGKISSDIFLDENSTGETQGGNITINVNVSDGALAPTISDRINIDGLSGTSRSGISTTFQGGRGKAGNIEINTGNLSVTNGGELSTFSRGNANAGNITINAKDDITFDGFGIVKANDETTLVPSVANTFHIGDSPGNGGNIQVSGKSLFLTNGGNFIAANTGLGNAGNIYLDIRDRVNISGIATNGIISSVPSGLVTFADNNGGEIKIETGSLRVSSGGLLTSFAQQNGGDVNINAREDIIFDDSADNSILGTGILSSLSQGEGTAGNINISGKSLILVNGAFLISSTTGKGDAGDIKVNVSKNISFDGVFDDGISSGILSTIEPGATGNGGNVEIIGNSLFLTDGAQINTSTSGRGNAGNIKIDIDDTVKFDGVNTNGRISGVYSLVGSGGEGKGGNIDIASRLLRLNQADISVTTASGDGGNLNFDIKDALILRRSSQISTTAGTQQTGGNGGDINIDSPIIAAISSENSNISANAFSGNGGNINIVTEGMFGISPRPQSTNLSDITASSQLGVQGDVSVSEPDVDPEQGITELPAQFEDKSSQIGQVCPRTAKAAGNISKFTITGRGSLPPSPLKPLSGKANLTRLATLDSDVSGAGVEEGSRREGKVEKKVKKKVDKKIIEARGFMKGKDGNIYLVAQTGRVTPNFREIASVCSTQK